MISVWSPGESKVLPGVGFAVGMSTLLSDELALWQIEQENLGIVGGCHDSQQGLTVHRGAIARPQRLAVHVDGAARHLQPGAAARPQRVRGLIARVEERRVEVGVLVDDNRA